ncbi:MAG: hypothetical protein IPL87_02210 [Candidatus Moraniibacteriota bacterium]|nr:MAG: hypothetical protein IPL87_02210 [Candidatus Moranbacteria bacterium]
MTEKISMNLVPIFREQWKIFLGSLRANKAAFRSDFLAYETGWHALWSEGEEEPFSFQ